MDGSELYDLEGEEVEPSELSIQNCVAVKRLIADEDYAYFELLQCKKDDSGNEYLVFDVEPSIPQKPKIEIRKRERIGVKFLANEDGKPITFALRKNFPHAPHINYSPEGTPKNLCLSIHLFEEEKIRWTAAKHLQRIHRWLSLTSKNKLHLDDQPLENVFYGSPDRVILPSLFYDFEKPVDDLAMEFVPIVDQKNRIVIVGLDQEVAKSYSINSDIKIKAVTIDIKEPIVHGIIDLQPNNLYGLHNHLKNFNKNLLSDFQSRLFQANEKDLNGYKLLLVIRIPKKRTNEGEVEAYEIITFFSPRDLLEISGGLGIYRNGPRQVISTINHTAVENAKIIELTILNPSSILTTKEAALYNNIDSSNDIQLSAIGLGTLGSQIIINTIKAGQGCWKLIDKDKFLPHNAARHVLPSVYMGFPKSVALDAYIKRIFIEESIVSPHEMDILQSDIETLSSTLSDSEYIFDFAASVAVSRRLTLDLDLEKPIISFFLNPKGDNLVLLSESDDKLIGLDCLEMEYYKSLYSFESLVDHLNTEEGIRYAQNCRDTSSRIPQYSVSVHSGIGSKKVLDILSNNESPQVCIWHLTDNLSVEKTDVKPSNYKVANNELWTVKVSDDLLTKLDNRRAEKLPNETGGVLIGSFDHERHIVYAVDLIASPSDSDEYPNSYIRGTDGLNERVTEVQEMTNNNLQYIGEWHSHPDGAALTPSNDDKKLFGWIEGYMKFESFPAIMVIVGEMRSNWYVSQVDNAIEFNTGS